MEEKQLEAVFDKWCKKLQLVPDWSIKLEFVTDPSWPKTGDFKIDCDDKTAILMLNISAPKQENLEGVIVHELMHLKLYPLDQVTESLITSNFTEGTAAYEFAYTQFFYSAGADGRRAGQMLPVRIRRRQNAFLRAL